jgi:hypothetical protein
MNPRETLFSISAVVAVGVLALGVVVRERGPAANETLLSDSQTGTAASLSRKRGFGVALSPRSFERPAYGRSATLRRADAADEASSASEDLSPQASEVVRRFTDAANVVVDTSPDSAAYKVALSELERSFRSMGPLDEPSRRLVAQAWELVAEHRGKVDTGARSTSTLVGE